MKKTLMFFLVLIIIAGAIFVGWMLQLSKPNPGWMLGKCLKVGPDWATFDDVEGPVTLKTDKYKIRVVQGKKYSITFDKKNNQIMDTVP